MFEAVSSKVDFPALEAETLRFWAANDIFGKSLAQRKDLPEYVFYDGPPFATGLPHYGHLLAGTIKDIVPRYQSMRGHYIERRFGWDCHGLPVEYEVEQSLNISGKSEIEKMGVGAFNEQCRRIVLRYTEEWRKIVTRMGRWVDFDNDYKTMDPTYMESIWWVFKSLWDRGLVYEGRKVLPYCPRCSTPLSNFEANQGYEDVTDPAITVRFRLRDEPGAYVLAWTTTPWTLPSNLALAVGRDIEYVRVEDEDEVYYLAAARLPVYYKKTEGLRMTVLHGRDLVGRHYEPVFPYFADVKEGDPFRIIAADFVSTEDGTGIVHMAPGFGEDDYMASRQEGLPVVCPVDAEGRFTDEVPDYAGRRVKETDTDIIARLKAEGSLIHRSTIVHSYPHCWRCDTALIYRGISTWFVRVSEMRERIMAANAGVRWVPDHLRDGRFGKWLEGARDWAVSRNRYWGTPLPVWTSEDGRERVCVGSIAELEALSGQKVSDLHKHHVDGIVIPSAGGGVLRRIPEVLDCWFESGAMPYAQAHYPFENKERFESHFPADFIAEGLDQTRGWFYTLMVLSVALFDKPAFRNVVVNGLVLAEDGRKMSKRLKNYPDPAYMLDTYGADALRLYLIHSPVVRAEDLRFSEEGVKHVMRHLLIPLWNAYSFFVTYANIDGWEPSPAGVPAGGSTNVLDRWILSSQESLVSAVVSAMDNYDLQRSVRPFVGFMEDLTNWYIRRSRRRFWKSRDDADKAQAYATLHRVLLEFSKIAAPLIPFVSEQIYRNLRSPDMPESVHLCDYPVADGSLRDQALEEEMSLVMRIVGMGRLLRSEHDLKVRQPLSALHVVSRDRTLLARTRRFEELVTEELNVKTVIYDERDSALAVLRGKPDYRVLGPKLGPRVKPAAAAIAKLPDEELDRLASGGETTIQIEGEPFVIGAGDVVIERVPREGMVVASEGELVVALETLLDDDLILEGLAREFVNRTQNIRRAAGLEVTDRIRVTYGGDAIIRAAVKRHGEYIAGEVLSLSCEYSDGPVPGEALDLNGRPAKIHVAKA